MRWCRKGLPFMMMYIAGVSAFAEFGLETLYYGTTPGSQSQVEPHLCTIRGWS